MASDVKTRKVDPYAIDEETAPLTDEEIARLRPTREVFAELGMPMPRRRGPQKTPTKQQVTLRLDPDLIDHFKTGGRGWQTRLNAALRAAVEAERD